MPSKSPAPKKSKAKSSRSSKSRKIAESLSIPRATSTPEDDDLMMAKAPARGFGRCGGRLLSSSLEQVICDRLGSLGVTHSHSPRHFEVRLDENSVAAYAPMIVLRGRGREGKTVIIEASETNDSPILEKIQAFRGQYGAEFYMIFVAPEEVLDEVSFTLYDESASTQHLNTLISRLAE